MKSPIRQRLQRGFTLIELMIVVAIIGILAAIAIPNFTRFQAKSKQSEVKTNLKAIFTAAKSYFAERDNYGSTFNNIGFASEPGGRYKFAWNSSTGGNTSVSCTPDTAVANTTLFTGTACGNVDTDATVDKWFINDTNTLSNTSDDVIN